MGRTATSYSSSSLKWTTAPTRVYSSAVKANPTTSTVGYLAINSTSIPARASGAAVYTTKPVVSGSTRWTIIQPRKVPIAIPNGTAYALKPSATASVHGSTAYHAPTW